MELPATLLQGRNGNFYGTTQYGGASGGGTVFKLTPGGVLTTLHTFDPNSTAGFQPFAALLQVSDRRLYGTALNGPKGGGVVFRLNPPVQSASY